jgi:hypothetical protein
MNTLSDEANAEKMHKNMQPTEKSDDELRRRSDHAASQKERDAISKEHA